MRRHKAEQSLLLSRILKLHNCHPVFVSHGGVRLNCCDPSRNMGRTGGPPEWAVERAVALFRAPHGAICARDGGRHRSVCVTGVSMHRVDVIKKKAMACTAGLLAGLGRMATGLVSESAQATETYSGVGTHFDGVGRDGGGCAARLQNSRLDSSTSRVEVLELSAARALLKLECREPGSHWTYAERVFIETPQPCCRGDREVSRSRCRRCFVTEPSG